MSTELQRKFRNLYYQIINPFRRLYWFIFRPKTRGVKCVLTNQDKILLVRLTYAHDRWTFPGGGVERDETFEQAVVREIKEEVGIDLKNLFQIGEYVNQREYKIDTVRCFYSEVAGLDFKIDEMEIKGAAWFALDRMPDYRVPNVDRIISMYQNREK